MSEAINRATEAMGLPQPRAIPGRDFAGGVLYAWMRDGQCLYVGQSSRGLRRIFETHHVISDVQPADEIYVWPFEGDDFDRTFAEAELIHQLKPKFNGTMRGSGVIAEPEYGDPVPHFRSELWKRLRGGR